MILKVFGILQRHAGEIGRRQSGGLGRELAVGKRASARRVADDARLGDAFRRRDAPRLGRRGDEHLPSRSADAAQGIVVERRRHAPAGELPAVFGGVERRLLDAHVFPFDVEFLGDDHRQHGLDALADLGVLRHDRHDAVRRDPDEGVEGSGSARGNRPPSRPSRRRRGRMACSSSPPPAAALALRKARRVGIGDNLGGAALEASRGHDRHHFTSAAVDWANAAFLIAARMRV